MTQVPGSIHPDQIGTRQSLSELVAAAQAAGLDTVLTSINQMLRSPLKLSLSGLICTVGEIVVENTDTTQKHTIPPINNLLPLSFANETVTIPASPTGNVTNSTTGDTVALNLTVSNYQRVGVNVNAVGQIIVTLGEENAVKSSASVPPTLSGAFAVGHFVIFNNAGTIEITGDSDLHQYRGGGGGGGSGDANVINTAIRDQLQLMPFDLATPNIFSSDGTDNVDSGNSTGSFSFVTSTFDLAAAQAVTSINNLDSAEFLVDPLDDVRELSLTVFWNLGNISTDATYEVSRDGGVTYESMVMESSGDSGVYVGSHRFTTNAGASLTAQASQTGTSELNATTEQQLSQSFSLSAISVVNSVDLTLTVAGSPTGVVFLGIYDDNAGVPGNLIAESAGVDISTLSTGLVNFSLPDVPLQAAATYHLVVRTDSTYLGVFATGATSISLAIDAAAGGASHFDGATWTAFASNALTFDLKGRPLDLRVRITAGAVPGKLDGWGVFYRPESAIAAGVQDSQTFRFSSTANTSQFTLNFAPDPKLLMVFYKETGQVFRQSVDGGAGFTISGNTVIFPPNTFFAAPAEDVTLEFIQFVGSTIDNSDKNANDIITITAQVEALGDKTEELDAISAPYIDVPNTDIEGRAQIRDLAQVSTPKMGTERVSFLRRAGFTGSHALEPINSEMNTDGKLVHKPRANDALDRIRLVGLWSAVQSSLGNYVSSADANDYIEIVFYGTGLNVVAPAAPTAANISVDGGGATAVTFPATSSVLSNREYNPHLVYPLVSDLSLGIHTVKLIAPAAGNIPITGVEILNETTALEIPAGTIISKEDNLTIPVTSTPYNSDFDGASDPVGTRGGHVVVYAEKDPDGSVAVRKRFTAVGSQLNLAAADHTNEEVIRKIHWTEFGAGRSDDFSTLQVPAPSSADARRYFTLDDGSTSLSGVDVARGGINGQALELYAPAGQVVITFVGTGLDFVGAASAGGGASVNIDVTIDGVATAGIPAAQQDLDVVIPIVSGLPYGTHTVFISRTSGSSIFAFKDIIIYGPKKPEIPTNAVELGSYNLMADFAANATSGATTVSTGVLRKSCYREISYINGSGGTQDWVISTPFIGSISGVQSASDRGGAALEYTFFGTGFDLRFFADTGRSSNIQLALSTDGSTFQNLNSTNFPGIAGNTSTYGGVGLSFTEATGIFDQQSTGGVSGAGLVISGLALNKYTLRMTSDAGQAGNFFAAEALDIITPIHVQSADRNLLTPLPLVGSNSIRSEAPLGNYKQEKQHFVGGVDLGPNKTKWQKKFLSSSITTATTDITDLRFNNLKVGMSYRLTVHAALDGTGAGSVITLSSLSGSTSIMTLQESAQAASWQIASGGPIVFTAAANAVTFNLAISGTGQLLAGEPFTFAILEELPNHVETKEF